VLYALSAFADGSGMGRCFPSLGQLMQATGLAKGTLCDWLHGLEYGSEPVRDPVTGKRVFRPLLDQRRWITRRKRSGKIGTVYRLLSQLAYASAEQTVLQADSPARGQSAEQTVLQADSPVLDADSKVLQADLPVLLQDPKDQEGPTKDQEEARAREGTEPQGSFEQQQPLPPPLPERLSRDEQRQRLQALRTGTAR
jgi:hypothetical protein